MAQNEDHAQEMQSDQKHFGCMVCRRRFRNAAGEAAHMCRAHGIVAGVRHLFDQPCCGTCLKHFQTLPKMKAHLYYSALQQHVT